MPFAPGYFVSSNGHVYSEKSGHRRQLKPWKNGSLNHLMVQFRVGGTAVKLLVHRVVATVFHGQAPTPRHEARHLDGVPSNNHKDNIAWGTHAENMADMVRHGHQGPKNHPERMRRGDQHPMRLRPDLAKCGSDSPSAKLNEDQVRAIRSRLETGERQADLAREFRVTDQLIYRIKNRLCWKHVA